MGSVTSSDENKSSSAGTWHRVSPIAIFYFFIQNIQHAINFWPALVGALASEQARAWLFTLGIPVLALTVVGSAFLSYWFFRYQFDAEKIQIRSGIFQKRRLVLNFDRVQEANLEQAIYFRPFGLWTLRLESAGSVREKIAIPGISETLALKIKQHVLFNKKIAENVAPELLSESETKPLVDFQIKLGAADLIRYGLMHNTMIYLVAILAPVFTQSDFLWRGIGNFVERMGLRERALDYLSTHSLWVDALLVSLLILVCFGLIYCLSILLAIIKYWNYTLNVQDERLQYQAGLFNRVACGFRKHKLQTVIIRQGLIASFLKRYTLEIKQTNEAVAQPGVPGQGFLIPVLDKAQLTEILNLLDIDEFDWQRTLPTQIFWRTFFVGGALTLITAITLQMNILVSPLWLLLPVPLVALWSWKYWHSTYYSLTENGFAIKRGLLGFRIAYMPQIKVQKLCLKQGPLGHAGKHGKLLLWSGASYESIGYIDIGALHECHARILGKVSNHRGRWM